MKVTFEDCYAEIVEPGGSRALREYVDWESTERYSAEVVPFVKSFASERIFAIGRAEFTRVQDRIESDDREHALKDVTSADNLSVTKNLNVPWAFVHLFHRYVETHPRLPTWLEWREWLNGPARPMFIAPAFRTLEMGRQSESRREQIRRGLRWRLGLVYYSCMRELDVLIRLRDECQTEARYHVLADALFKVDFWHGFNTVSLFISNKEMKAAQEGRKDRPGAFLDDPPFNNQDIVLEKQSTYGTLHLATDESVCAIATILQTPNR